MEKIIIILDKAATKIIEKTELRLLKRQERIIKEITADIEEFEKGIMEEIRILDKNKDMLKKLKEQHEESKKQVKNLNENIEIEEELEELKESLGE